MATIAYGIVLTSSCCWFPVSACCCKDVLIAAFPTVAQPLGTLVMASLALGGLPLRPLSVAFYGSYRYIVVDQ